MIAVITGSTGLVGSLLLSKLLQDKATTQVISVTRKSLGLNNPKLKEVIVPDFANLMDHKDEMKGDIYFCALGTTIKTAGSKENFKKVDYDAVVNFGKVAEYHKAQSLTVVSANMANPKSAVFYNQIKGETEHALMDMQLNRLILLRPGLLIGERAEKRTGEKFAISLLDMLSPILPEKIEKTIATKIETLTTRMLKEGQNPAPKIKIINAVDI
ncbi:NAD-dependent epimerase/dehydratase family protein [Bacteriovorax sp. PP10]|uniref:NAD-dependent epimerase/dehydratase family protein n=1 Tax=Bacteriovorax antarcticus TaxID=3088717 RepID=A0ABU5VRI3_9BACT|nr:NAD-dependent epimerase/dehydratase family protein [Bacteriovorax sp. PP10]MEA9355657.1 NAD-dependent epimerase/dehydratase family protein [Bacteriovorax sp. PP10]